MEVMSTAFKRIGLLLGACCCCSLGAQSSTHGARTVGGDTMSSFSTGRHRAGLGYLGGDGKADIIAPNAEVMYRGGATDTDISVSLTGLGMVALDLKFELLDLDMVTLAVDPSIGGVFLGLGDVSTGYLQIQAPFMVDIHANDLLTVSLAAKYSGFYTFASEEDLGTADAFTHWMGGTFGMRFNVTESYAVMPYGGFMMPVAGVNDSLSDINVWSAGVGFIYRN